VFASSFNCVVRTRTNEYSAATKNPFINTRMNVMRMAAPASIPAHSGTEYTPTHARGGPSFRVVSRSRGRRSHRARAPTRREGPGRDRRDREPASAHRRGSDGRHRAEP